MVKRPFLLLGLASFFAAFFSAHIPSSWLLPIACAAAVLLVLCAVFRNKHRIGCVVLALVGILLTVLGYGLREWYIVRPMLSYDGQNGFVVLRVEDTAGDGETFLASAEQGMLPKGTRVCLWTETETVPEMGDLVFGRVHLTAAFRDPLSARAQSARAFGTYLYAWEAEEGSLSVASGRSTLAWWQAALYDTREWIHDTVASDLSPSAAALCESMLIGEREALPSEIEGSFRRGGVYHLLVVSGLHLTLIAGALLSVLKAFRVPRKLRVLLTMAAVILFTALCGFSASVMRAAVMVLVALTATLLHRRADGLNTVGMTAFFMLLADPYCVLDIGWQLSFAATVAMIAFVPVWEREVTSRVKRRLPRIGRVLRPVMTAVGISLCATLMTQPLTTLYFRELSLVFLPTNLLCVPLASAVVVLSMLGLLLCWCPPLATLCFTAVEYVTMWMIGYTRLWSSVPSFGGLPPYMIWWLFALTAVIAAAYRLKNMRGVWRASAGMLAVLCLACVLHTVLMQGVCTVVTAPSNVPCLLVKTPEGNGAILTETADAEDTAEWLAGEGIRSLSWILLTADTKEDGVPLSVETEHLVLTEDSSLYAAFPAASRVSMLEDGRELRIGREASVLRIGDSYRVMLGNTSVVLCGGTKTEQLPPAWKTPQLLVLSGAVPQGLSDWDAEHTVVYGAVRECEAIRNRLPHRFEAVWLPGTEEPPAFFTRGNEDIALRGY